MPKELHLRPVKKLIIDKINKGKLIKTGSFTYNEGATEAEKQQKAKIEYNAEVHLSFATVKFKIPLSIMYAFKPFALPSVNLTGVIEQSCDMFPDFLIKFFLSIIYFSS